MKNLFKGVFGITIILICMMQVKAIQLSKKERKIEVYEIKAIDNALMSNSIIDFYENDTKKAEILKIRQEKENQKVEIKQEIPQVNLELNSNIVNFATSYVGNPYISGGTSLTEGADCSGFVQTVYANFNIYLPRTTYEQSIFGKEVLIDEIEIGDIISYGYDGYSSHSAIYIGDGHIVHAATPELGIRVDSMYIMPIITIRRVI